MKEKSLPKLKEDTQKLFNKWIRKRDSKDGYFNCISCGQNKSFDQMNAGHYYSVKQYDALRFNTDNVHGQCIHCNKWLDGNLLEYTDHLIEKIGTERFERLKIEALYSKRSTRKWSRFELKLITDDVKIKLGKASS